MERTYKTQMEAARKGIITPEMKKVAAKEYRTEEEIRQWVAEGKVAICANKNHKCICDRIIVIDEGRIIEDGTYDELISENGFFAELVERQRLDV